MYQMEKLVKFFFGIWAIWAAIAIAFNIAIIVVIVHFVTKYW